MTEIDRRTVLGIGLTGAVTIAMAGCAEQMQQARQDPPMRERMEIKDLGTFNSMIAGIPKVRLRELTYQPGGRSSSTMPNDMVCECTEGILEITLDAQAPMTVRRGELWTCRQGMREASRNPGSTPAVMRVVDLLKG
jgi:uncharacterized cupin superfamily protein